MVPGKNVKDNKQKTETKVGKTEPLSSMPKNPPRLTRQLGGYDAHTSRRPLESCPPKKDAKNPSGGI